MDNFQQLIEGIERHTSNLNNLEQDYKNCHKGGIYQIRRSQYRDAIKNYIYRLKKLVQGPKIYNLVGTIDGKKFEMTTINMNAEQTKQFLELTTKQEIEIIHSETKNVGEIQFLQ